MLCCAATNCLMRSSALHGKQCCDLSSLYLQVDLFDCCNLLRVWCDVHVSLQRQ